MSFMVCFGQPSTYQSLHHVGLGVAQSLDGEEDVHHLLVPQHLQHHEAGAEGPTAATAVAADECA